MLSQEKRWESPALNDIFDNEGMFRVAEQPLDSATERKQQVGRFMEVIKDLTEDDIPLLLDWIRDVKRSKISEIVWEKHKESVHNKVIDFTKYLKDKLTNAA